MLLRYTTTFSCIFFTIKHIKEAIKVNNVGMFIPILLCHNTDPFYILRHIYFISLVLFLVVVPKYSLDTHNKQFFNNNNTIE